LQASPEFRLAIECCRSSFAGAAGKPIDRPAIEFDWSLFLQIIAFHRIEGLAWNTLSGADFSIPRDIEDQISTAATSIAADSLRAVAESAALREDFAAASVPLLFLKGLTLGSLAYGKAALKAAVDIDLLIDPDNLESAASVLRKRGYNLIVPANGMPLEAWHRRSKESVWAKGRPQFQIDLHTRAAENPLLIPEIVTRSSSQLVDVGAGQRLATLAVDDLFAYLSVHGGTSTWFRLKWISDFAGLLSSKEPSEVHRLYRRSQELGAGRAAAQGLLLADLLFDTLAGNVALREELKQDRVTRLLVRTALGLLTRVPTEPTERLFGTLPLHVAPIFLMPGWRYKASALSGQVGWLMNRFVS